MNKKVNCKHGLTKKEELLARKLKNKIVQKDEKTIEVIQVLFKQWKASRMEGERMTFGQHVLKRNKALYSAILRVYPEVENNITFFYLDLISSK